ncbi:PDDEXK family nuclease [Paenibacillus durus]|uniref:hypothetical protein n=1 Tax=Paenibacillus durus TaxID=44251 RepID=UPI0006940AAE|nr:hypothetical protein [Paenibacillus durus]
MVSTKRKTTDEFFREVEELTGGEYVFFGEYRNNKTKMQAKHSVCGRVFFISPHRFLAAYKERKGGCPDCTMQRVVNARRGDPAEQNARIQEALGDDYVLLSSYVNSRTKVSVKHLVCGTSFSATPNNILSKGSRCPGCKISKGEDAIRKHLESIDVTFAREYRTPDCKHINTLPFDFAVFGEGHVVLLIEFDGEQHFEQKDFFGGRPALLARKRNDRIKNEYCSRSRTPLLRIPYWKFDQIPELINSYLLDSMAIPSEAC